MRRFSAAILAVTTVATIVVMWEKAKWATTLPEIAMCIIALGWAVMAASGRTVRTAWVIAPLFGMAALAAVQIVTGITVYSWPTRMAALYWTGNVATFFVALQFLTDRETRIRYLDVLLGFAGLTAVFCTIHAATSISMVYWTFPQALEIPLFGPFLYVNQYAAFVELTLPLAIYGALTRERGARVLCILAAAILFGSVLYSASRGGAVLTFLELAAVPVLVARRRGLGGRQLLNTGLVMMVALLWVGVAAGPDKLIVKFSTQEAFSGRMEFNRASLAMIRDRPILGFGLGNWPTVYVGYATSDDNLYVNQAHNDWAQWTAEGGVPALALMLAVLVWAAPRAVRSGWGLGVLIVLIHCLWDYPIQRTGVAIVFFTMLAAIAPYGRQAKRADAGEEPEDALDEAALAP